MFRKIITAVIAIPVALIVIAFAVANRQWITLSFDPFSSASPAYAASLPLFVLIFIAVILGMIVGGVVTWMRQSKWRRLSRRLEGEVHALHEELASQRRQFAERRPDRAPEPVPLIVPPTS